MFKQLFNTKYEIDESGRVRCPISKYNKNKDKAIDGFYYLSPSEYNTGYLYYTLTIGNKKNVKYTIHRLVAEHFLANKSNFPCINHKDGNKHNNDVSNLEWCTYKDNSIHAVNLGLIKSGSESHLYGIKGDKHPCSIANKGNKYNLGHKHSLETKQKISQKLMGNKNGSRKWKEKNY